MSIKLKEFQRSFINYIYNNKLTPDFRESINSESVQDSLKIYQNNALLGVLSALQNNFAVTRKLIGNKQFDQLANDCIKRNHSKSGNLDDYSDEFISYIKNITPNTDLYHFLIIEKAYWDIRNKSDDQPDSLESFQNIQSDKLEKTTFLLNPSIVELGDLDKHTINHFLENSNFRNIKLNIKKDPIFIIGYKISHEIIIISLNSLEYDFYKILKKKINLAAIFQQLEKNKSGKNIGELLNFFIKEKIIYKFTFN